MAAMIAGAVTIRHRLAEEAEEERHRQAEIARQQRERARRDRAIKRHEYLVRKASEFAQLQKLEALADHVRYKLRSGDSDYAQALGKAAG